MCKICFKNSVCSPSMNTNHYRHHYVDLAMLKQHNIWRCVYNANYSIFANHVTFSICFLFLQSSVPVPSYASGYYFTDDAAKPTRSEMEIMSTFQKDTLFPMQVKDMAEQLMEKEKSQGIQNTDWRATEGKYVDTNFSIALNCHFITFYVLNKYHNEKHCIYKNKNTDTKKP